MIQARRRQLICYARQRKTPKFSNGMEAIRGNRQKDLSMTIDIYTGSAGTQLPHRCTPVSPGELATSSSPLSPRDEKAHDYPRELTACPCYVEDIPTKRTASPLSPLVAGLDVRGLESGPPREDRGPDHSTILEADFAEIAAAFPKAA